MEVGGGVGGESLELGGMRVESGPCSSTDQLKGLGSKSLCLKMSHLCQL